MKPLIICHGSRGDVQPFIALGLALKHAGHDPVLAVPGWAHDLVKHLNLRPFHLSENTEELHRLRKFRSLRNTTYRGWEYATQALRPKGQLLARTLHDVAAAVSVQPDVIIHYPVLHGHQLAELLRIPAVAVHPLPALVPTSSFPNPMFPVQVPKLLNRYTYFWTRVFGRAIFGSTRSWRRHQLGLPLRRAYANPLRRPDGSPATVLYPFSRHILPARTKFPDHVHFTGFWYTPIDSWTPPMKLTSFLNSNTPTIYAGFASRVEDNSGELGAKIAKAARDVGVRLVVVTGSGNGIDVPDNDKDIFRADEIPFDWLFPKMDAILHHGGIGTTATALLAGRPQVVCPRIPSQRFVANAVHTHGTAPAPLDPRSLTTYAISKSIESALSEPSLRKNAQRLSNLISGEPGTSSAIEIIENECARVPS